MECLVNKIRQKRSINFEYILVSAVNIEIIDSFTFPSELPRYLENKEHYINMHKINFVHLLS